MAKTKAEKITSIEEEIRQLENRRRQLVQEQKAQERKDRTKRLCRRMGLFESLVPDSIPLTDEQFKTFLEKTVMTDPARRILDGMTARNAPTAPAQGAETAAQGQHAARRQNRPYSPRGRRRRGHGRGRLARVTGLHPYPCLKARAHLYTTMNVVCAVLQTAFCACRHKRERRELPAERSAARGNLPLQYQSHIPRQGQVRCCRRRLPGGGKNHK